MNVPVLIVGPSGNGKSSTFRTLPPEETVIINTERKPMPFRNFTKFKNINISRYKDFTKVMKELATSKKYKYVVIDSFTSLTEIVGKYTDTVFTGFEQWKQYNVLLQDALWLIKDLPQQVFMTGIPEYLENGDEPEGYIRVKGKELKYGGTEKEFAIVLWTSLASDDEGNITGYMLDTKPSKLRSSKSPDGMFEDRLIPNDAKAVADAIEKYYSET